MKAIVVDPSLFAPFYDYHFCSALSELGVDVTLVIRPLRPHEPVASGSFEVGEHFYRRAAAREVDRKAGKLSRILKSLEHYSGLRTLEKLVNEKRPDVIHFQWLLVPLLDRILLERLRGRCGLVLTVHNADISAHSAASVVGALGETFQSLGRKSAVKSFDRYVAHSQKTVDRLLEMGISMERILLKPHPPLEFEVPVAKPKSGMLETRREILFFGAIKPYKGVEVLIEAGIFMAKTRRDFRITIAGMPFQSMERLRARISDAGVEDVFRLDLEYVSNAKLAEYLADASIVVFPYLEIDGSGALSHAVHFGAPIVASNVGGFSEAPFRDHIELVAPGDSRMLAASLMGLLDDPERLKKLGDKSKLLREMLPSWRDYAQACVTAYRDVSPYTSKS